MANKNIGRTTKIVPQGVTQPTYTLSNVTTDRVLNADSYTPDELADVLCTLIQDLQAMGLLL